MALENAVVVALSTSSSNNNKSSSLGGQPVSFYVRHAVTSALFQISHVASDWMAVKLLQFIIIINTRSFFWTDLQSGGFSPPFVAI